MSGEFLLHGEFAEVLYSVTTPDLFDIILPLQLERILATRLLKTFGE